MAGHLRFGLLVATALAVLFPGLAFRGEALFERDLHQMLYGQYASIARLARAGVWPLWDPWPGFGQPLLANPAAQILYPPTWLCLLLTPEATYSVYVLAHLALGAFGVRALAGRLGVTPALAGGAGLVWMMSGPVLSLVNLWHHLAGAALMPLVLLAADGALRSPTVHGGLRWGAAAGLQALAGSFDMCVLTAVLSAGWSAHSLTERAPDRVRASVSLLLPLVLAAGLALALSAGLLLPLLDLWRQSARASLSESVRTSWSVTPALLAQAFVPFFPQRLALPPDLQGRLLDHREPFLASIYLGFATLPVAAAAFLPKPRRHAMFLGGVALVLLGVALGRHGLVYPALVGALPLLSSLRYPVKATVAVALVWALLVALGAEAWRARKTGETRASGAPLLLALIVASMAFGGAWLALGPLLFAAPVSLAPTLVIGIVAFAAAARMRHGGRLAIGLLSLVGLDLALAQRWMNPTAPVQRLAAPPAVVSELPSSTFVRIHAWDYLARILGKSYRRAAPEVPRHDRPRDVDPALAAALARRDFLSPPVGARFGLYGGFDRDWLGLQPAGVRQLGLWFQAAEETKALPLLLRRGGVTHAVALHREGLEELEPVATVESPFAGPVELRRVKDPLPRAYAVDGVRVATGLKALQLLSDPGFAASRELILPEGVERASSPGAPSEARLVHETGDRLLVEADMRAAGHVVVLEAWDPGWQARCDGRPVPLLRANVGFRAVAVPPGHHEIEMTYRPRGLTTGLVSTIVAALVSLGALLVRPREERP
jgi:hypothetical protein